MLHGVAFGAKKADAAVAASAMKYLKGLPSTDATRVFLIAMGSTMEVARSLIESESLRGWVTVNGLTASLADDPKTEFAPALAAAVRPRGGHRCRRSPL